MPSFINEHLTQAPSDGNLFDFAHVEQSLISKYRSSQQITLTGSTDHQVQSLLEEMLEEYTERRHFYELVLKANLLKLLSILIRDSRKTKIIGIGDKTNKYLPLFASAIEYIHRHYQEDIRMDQLCKITMVSKTLFCDLFKHFTGKTFNDYLIDIRIKKSTELLLQPDLTITDVCYGVGFNNLNYFSKTFKKYTGISPSNYKKLCLDNSHETDSGNTQTII